MLPHLNLLCCRVHTLIKIDGPQEEDCCSLKMTKNATLISSHLDTAAVIEQVKQGTQHMLLLLLVLLFVGFFVVEPLDLAKG